MVDAYQGSVVDEYIFGKDAQRILFLAATAIFLLLRPIGLLVSAFSATHAALPAPSQSAAGPPQSPVAGSGKSSSSARTALALSAATALTASTRALNGQAHSHDFFFVRIGASCSNPELPAPLELQQL